MVVAVGTAAVLTGAGWAGVPGGQVRGGSGVPARMEELWAMVVLAETVERAAVEAMGASMVVACEAWVVERSVRAAGAMAKGKRAPEG